MDNGVLSQPIIVQKFGGTSVHGPAKLRNVARKVLAARDAGYAVVVVVSAPGKMTDELLQQASVLNSRPPARELDVLLSTGEQVSIALLSITLAAEGQPAVALTGWQAGIKTDAVHTKARILTVDTSRILRHLADGNVVVVAGFQGLNDNQDITTLGRGGSDLTAVALAAALEAEACEIYTDVDGVYTADPRIVPTARRLSHVSHAEMLEMASLGAGVMQASAIEYAMRLGVVLRVRSSADDGPGTWIGGDDAMLHNRVVTGVACDMNTAKVTLFGLPDRPGVAHKLFAAVAAKAVNVDLIIQTAGREAGTADLSFTVPAGELEKALEAAHAVAEELGGVRVVSRRDVAKVSIVGAGMMNTPGVAAKMFGALGDAGINIDLVGCSEIKVSCIINRDQAERATRVLHEAFELDQAS